MSDLYQNEDGVKVYVVSRDAVYVDGIGGRNVVVYRGISIEQGSTNVQVCSLEVFEAQFKRLASSCGVDIYAILHEHIGRGLAAEMADEIEAALAVVEEKRKHAEA